MNQASELLAARAKDNGWWHSIPQSLIEWDQKYFDLLKSSYSHSTWFWLADVLAHRWQGLVLLVLLLVYLFRITYTTKAGRIGVALFILQFTLTLALANFLSDEFKHLFGRLKPHVSMDIPGTKQPLSFPSNHSVNTATMLGFWWYALRNANVRSRKIAITLLTLTWIFTGWSRVFLGEHFPLDVAGGFLFGGIYGFYAAWLLSKARCSLGKRHQK